MSTRLGLNGFRLDQMRLLFGSGDPSVIAEMEAKLDRAVEEEGPDGRFDPAFCGAFRTTLRRVVEAGVPVPGLQVEGAPHVFLADWLAQYRQEHVYTDCDCKYFALLDFLEQLDELLAPSDRTLFGYLVEGRPLFGERFESTPLYGYLTFEEANVLRSSLERLAEGGLDDADIEELVTDFIGFLGEILPAGLDVWAFVG